MTRRSQFQNLENHLTDSTKSGPLPTFTGPIAAQADTTAAITPLDVSGDFDVQLNGALTVYTAHNLPVGLVIDPATGIITGTPEAAVVKSCSVTLETGGGFVTSNGFTWTIT